MMFKINILNFFKKVLNFVFKKKILVIVLSFCLLIYLFLPKKSRYWVERYLIPISFFSLMFFRTVYLTIIGIRGSLALSYISIVGLIDKTLLIVFMGILIFSYIIRISPDQPAEGIWERFYPAIVFILHIMGAHFIAIYTKINYVSYFFVTALSLCFIGLVLIIASLWQLRRSFSIMVEVRKLIINGPYKYIRHPIYTGEAIYWLGMTLLFNNRFAYGFFIAILVTQISRALLEEHKLSKYLEEYGSYKKRTGFIIPRLRPFSRNQ